MILDYFQWQFAIAPRWLLTLLWNLERASLRFFSIELMFRTLLAHWHKDAMTWKGGTLERYVTTVLWNIISRFIGLIIRSTVILIWVATQIVCVPLGIILFILFVSWPLLILIGISTGFMLLVT